MPQIGLLLHFFQPWWQFPRVMADIHRATYEPILNFVFEGNLRFAFTANIHQHLLSYWADLHPIFFGNLINAVDAGKIELTGTAKEHPILPLLTEKEAVKQIAADRKSKKVLGFPYAHGFFFPEMAYSLRDFGLIKANGYQWTVLEDSAFVAREKPFNFIPEVEGMAVFLRSSHWNRRVWDQHMSFEEIRMRMKHELPPWMGKDQAYLVFAMDAETFGHHVSYLLKSFLMPALSAWGGDGNLLPFKRLLEIFPKRDGEILSRHSWSTTAYDLDAEDPYPLWHSPKNFAHRLYARLLEIAFRHTDSPDMEDNGLKIANSCHTWWVSDRPHYKPEFMMYGAQLAMDIINRRAIDIRERTEAWEIFNRLENIERISLHK